MCEGVRKPRGANVIDERLIRETEAEVNRLEAACKLAASHRHESASAKERWVQACRACHQYESPLWELWTPEAQRDIVHQGGYWRTVAVMYLRVSPRFFRSGYLRDMVCHRLKQASLESNERSQIRDALLDGLNRRPPTGRFAYDCRLAARVADDEFLRALTTALHEGDLWLKGRATRMLQHAASIRKAHDQGEPLQ